MSRGPINTNAAVKAADTDTGILPQAGKTARLEQLVSDMTPAGLEAISPETKRKLLQAIASAEAAPSSTQKTSLQLAHEMVESYTFDKKTEVSTFTVPAGITDVEAMKALNKYSRKNLSRFNRDRDAVWAEHLKFFEKLSEWPTRCEQRHYSQARQITITGVVKGTQEKNRTTQERVLRGESLVFSDPRDQAIAAALHACNHDGQDLFKDLRVRGSVPQKVLLTDQFFGVHFSWSCADYDDSNVAASGSPSPELKKT